MKSLEINNKLLSKIILVLLGIFLTSLIFALSIELLAENGVLAGIILCLGTAMVGFYFTEKGDKIRLIAWSITISVFVSIAIFATILQIVSETLKGF